MTVPTLDTTAALGIAAGGVWAIHSAWTNSSPSLATLRAAAPGDVGAHTQLRDCSILVGGLALLAGGVVSLATHTLWPALLMGAALALLWWTHHAALTGPATTPNTGD
jgi:hypothetical protein